MKQSRTKNDKDVQYKIPRNVNSYRHLINLKEGSEYIINHALQLRTKDLSINLKKIPDQPFNVYGQDTVASKNNKKVGDYGLTMNQQQVEQCYRGKSLGYGMMAFTQSLRQNSYDQKIKQKEEKWNQYSSIQKNYYNQYVEPTYGVSRRNLQKMRENGMQRGQLPNRAQPRVNQTVDYYCGLYLLVLTNYYYIYSDGNSNFQKYNSKLPLYNLSEYKFMLSQKNDVNKNIMGWTSQLRENYTNEPLHHKNREKMKRTKQQAQK